MYRLALLCIVWVAVPVVAVAAAPAEETVQGLYEGVRKDAGGEHKFEARVVACGKGTYKIFLREPAAGGEVTKAELDGQADGDAVSFQGKVGQAEWAASYADGAIAGTCGKDGKVQMKRIERASPTLGVKPPAEAVVLLDGRNFEEVLKRAGKDGKEPEWKVGADGGVLVPKGGMRSKRTFAGSFKLHVEFKNPLMSAARGQGRGNSGVFMPNGEEIQVLDSFGMTTYTGGGCGGLYKWKDPDAFDEFSLASLPPTTWQTYDIEYVATTKDGKPGRPLLTVRHNGIPIHDKVELRRDAKPGAFSFQDHGCPVEYRNIWVLPAEGK